MSMQEDDPPCPWYSEADRIELSSDDLETASCAELPEGDEDFAIDAAEDDAFDAEYDEWLSFLFESEIVVLLGLEQACHEGALLPWDMRAVRLAGIPGGALSKLHFFWDHCPEHVAAYLTMHIYWALRFERVRRMGHPNWSCRDPVPPVQEDSAFFRPSRLVFRRQI